MIAYLDSSAVLRFLAGADDAFHDFFDWSEAFSSELLKVECKRTMYRWRLNGEITDEQLNHLLVDLQRLVDMITLVKIDSRILEKSADPMATSIGTLDAIHLSTALIYKSSKNQEKIVLSHDRALNLAASSCGLQIKSAL